MGFTKLDERIAQSSIMAESSDTFKVFIILLATCKANGVSYSSAVYLSSICRLSMEVVELALNILQNPDPHSRSLNEDGRRIKRVDGGWEIINYPIYREASINEIEAERKRVYRARAEGSPGQSGTVQGPSASASVLIIFNHTTDNWNNITDIDKSNWKEAYPACDINIELKKMREWMLANPKKGKKSNYRRFIVNWLSKTQDKGGTRGQPATTKEEDSKKREEFLRKVEEKWKK